MEKNENGYPQGRTTPDNGRNGTNGRTETDRMNNNGAGNGTQNGGMNNNGTQNGRMNGNGMTNPRDGDTMPHSMNNGCGEMTDDCLDGRPLAYVYAPNQRFCMLYSAKDALDRGTLFEALYKPMEVYGRE